VVTRVLKVDAAVTDKSHRLVARFFFVFSVLVLSGTCLPRSAASAPANKKGSERKTGKKKAPSVKPKPPKRASKAAAGPVPEKVILEEEPSPPTSTSKSKRAADEREDAADEREDAADEREDAADEREPVADRKPEPSSESGPATHGGPSAHASIETSGYLDSDHVNVLSPSVAVGLSDEVAGWSVNGHYLVDVVSAASVDIVSTASPHWTEVRHVGGMSGSVAFEPVTVGAVGVISREPDYLSITGGGTLSIDLFEKNVTPYFAFSREQDSIGRTDLPHEYWKDKHVTNVQAGVTLVLGRPTIASVQVDGSFERGYLAKPYRYVPLFAPGQAASVGPGASIDEVNRLRLNMRAIEQLPNARDRYALSGHLAHRGTGTTLRLDERLYADSWGLLAATSELRYIIDVSRRLEIWPHVRHHIQGAVNFWQRAYEAIPGPDGSLGVPVFRTGDRELGPLQIIVLGAGARLKLANSPGSQWDLVWELDVGRTSFTDQLYITERRMAYSTLALEATF
jgi:hypothetical protein